MCECVCTQRRAPAFLCWASVRIGSVFTSLFIPPYKLLVLTDFKVTCSGSTKTLSQSVFSFRAVRSRCEVGTDAPLAGTQERAEPHLAHNARSGGSRTRAKATRSPYRDLAAPRVVKPPGAALAAAPSTGRVRQARLPHLDCVLSAGSPRDATEYNGTACLASTCGKVRTALSQSCPACGPR